MALTAFAPARGLHLAQIFLGMRGKLFVETLLKRLYVSAWMLPARGSKLRLYELVPLRLWSIGYRKRLGQLDFPGYNQSVMSMVRDAAQESQFASSFFTSGLFTPGRVLAALPGVPAALSGEPAFAIASQPLR